MNKKQVRKKTAGRQGTSRMDPALRAALIWLLPSILIRVVTGIIGLPWVAWVLQILFYVLCGYMAASGYYETVRRIYPKGKPTEQLRSGAKAGITLGILLSVSLVILILLAVWLAPVLMISAPAQIFFVFLIPVDILGGLFLGALGGKLFKSARR